MVVGIIHIFLCEPCVYNFFSLLCSDLMFFSSFFSILKIMSVKRCFARAVIVLRTRQMELREIVAHSLASSLASNGSVFNSGELVTSADYLSSVRLGFLGILIIA